jgi:hypothetical protein
MELVPAEKNVSINQTLLLDILESASEENIICIQRNQIFLKLEPDATILAHFLFSGKFVTSL